jgi:hypothetical protein
LLLLLPSAADAAQQLSLPLLPLLLLRLPLVSAKPPYCK